MFERCVSTCGWCVGTRVARECCVNVCGSGVWVCGWCMGAASSSSRVVCEYVRAGQEEQEMDEGKGMGKGMGE